MLVVTADDYGMNSNATDNILRCFQRERITSASAMVFMEDSARAASAARESDLEVGLHLNFTAAFSAGGVPEKFRASQERVACYLSRHSLAQAIYNPFLAGSFALLVAAQQEEFRRLYGSDPAFYNGHHHMHLCANVMWKNLIPAGERVRRSFTFNPGEKDRINLLYRSALNSWVSRKYVSTDFFFSVEPIQDMRRLTEIVDGAAVATVEIEVHPEDTGEMEFLLSDDYKAITERVKRGQFRQLDRNRSRGKRVALG